MAQTDNMAPQACIASHSSLVLVSCNSPSRGHPARTCCKDMGKPIDPGCDLAEAIRPMVDSVHGRNVGQQRLRSADVAGSLVSPDVLLPGLHGHAQRGLAIGIAAQACRQRPGGSYKRTVMAPRPSWCTDKHGQAF